jgi:hypothetical protein
LRGNNQAQGASGQANANANTFMGNANSLYSTAVPALTSEEENPQGYNPADLAKMKTENMETAGGSEAGAVGQGGLLAARTRNAGAPMGAIASAARSAGQNLSRANLGVDTKDAMLKEQQRQAGLSGLENLTGLETGASNAALGQVASNVNANTNAANQSWDWAKYLLDPAMQDASSGASNALRGP